MSTLSANGIYTATQNCIVAGYINLKMNTNCCVLINNTTIGYYSAPTNVNIYVSAYYPLKQGQRIAFNISNTPHEFLVRVFERN